jgi:group I intron endonuclease
VKFYIYIIENKVADGCYIGKTNDMKRRWATHCKNALKESMYMTHLYRAMKKYGIESFEMRTLEEHDNEKYVLEVLEPAWIARMRDEGRNVYNMTDGGEGCSGLIFSHEHRQKISEALRHRVHHPRGSMREDTKQKISKRHMGRTFSNEHRQKLREAAQRRSINRPLPPLPPIPKKPGKKPGTKGGPMSEEQKQKLREANLGKSPSEETRQKLSETNRGKPKPPRTEEHRRKLRESAQSRGPMSEEQKTRIAAGVKASKNVGHPIDEETRARIAEKLRGQVQSEETRAKRAESMRRAWERRRASQPQAQENDSLLVVVGDGNNLEPSCIE